MAETECHGAELLSSVFVRFFLTAVSACANIGSAMRILTQDEVIGRLRKLQSENTATYLAHQIGITSAHMSEIMRKKCQPTKKVLRFLGLRREKSITYTYFELNGAKGKK